MLKATADGPDGVQRSRILSDDTDAFVLLMYWTSRMRFVAKSQWEKWNGDVLDVRRAASP